MKILKHVLFCFILLINLSIALALAATNPVVTVYYPSSEGTIKLKGENGAYGTSFKPGELVRVEAEPARGYAFVGINVVEINGETEVDEDTTPYPVRRYIYGAWTDESRVSDIFSNSTETLPAHTCEFVMPSFDMVIVPVFTKDLTAEGGLYVIMPTTYIERIYIPYKVKSFKVYGYSGKKTGRYYSGSNANGYLYFYTNSGKFLVTGSLHVLSLLIV